MLSQVVASQAGQQRVVFQDVADTCRIHEFLRTNPLEFIGSNITKDPEKFVEDLKKAFAILHTTDVEGIKLESYQLKGVAKI
ncbi:hypothetical protein H5410_045716 [Solanum commersonii]|uniref:Gag-pol polyprotein n=1 Tax=Solanum commersonii TaxID=4109 RepID=A0A9J5XC06_SOLCO|nr:hypothetical protein H5410_045716 [Solanum commersonii]